MWTMMCNICMLWMKLLSGGDVPCHVEVDGDGVQSIGLGVVGYRSPSDVLECDEQLIGEEGGFFGWYNPRLSKGPWRNGRLGEME